MKQAVLFIDRDGTIIEEPDDFQVDRLSKIQFVAGVIPALLELKANGYMLVLVSNQDGLGTDAFPQDDFDRCQRHIMDILASQGIEFSEVFICPHLAADNCACRKPRAGLLTAFLASHDLDLQRSAVIGDRETDLELANAIGVQGIRINSDQPGSATWAELVVTLCHSQRVARCSRRTNETQIDVAVNLDSSSLIEVATGIGFFDHMLEQLAKHGAFGLQLRCHGDLEIDEHHTVEDVAICLGNALRDALGSKHGIGRYGFLLPMDESLADIAIDLSGRAALQFDATFPRTVVGEFSTEMVKHFFHSLAESLGAALHIKVRGENTHHMIEASFKGVGRALARAIARDGNEMPSTKGTLSA